MIFTITFLIINSNNMSNNTIDKNKLNQQIRKTKNYKELYSVPWKLFLDKPVQPNLNLNIAVFVNPCYGFGDVIFALKIYNYIREWYNINPTIVTTKPKIFLDNGIENVLCVKIPNKPYKECDNTRLMETYTVNDEGECVSKLNLDKETHFDLILAAPWIGTDYEPDYKALKRIFPYATKFNTFLFSEYNAPDPHKYDFPTGLGKGLYGILLNDINPAEEQKLLQNPFLMVHMTEDFRSDISKCFSGFIKLMCKKYSKSISNLDVVLPKHIIKRKDLLTKLEKWIKENGHYDRLIVIESKDQRNQITNLPKTLTFRADITPLPHKQYSELFQHALPDVLITGDQSVTDIISCCRKYNIYYQIMPWKRNFARNLSNLLDNPNLSKVSTACGLEKMSIKKQSDSEMVYKKGDFRKVGKRKLDAVLLATKEIKENPLLKSFKEIILKSRKRNTVIDKLIKKEII